MCFSKAYTCLSLPCFRAFDTFKRVAEKYNYTFPEPVSDNDVLRDIKVICKRLITMNNNVEKKYTRGGQKR